MQIEEQVINYLLTTKDEEFLKQLSPSYFDEKVGFRREFEYIKGVYELHGEIVSYKSFDGWYRRKENPDGPKEGAEEIVWNYAEIKGPKSYLLEELIKRVKQIKIINFLNENRSLIINVDNIKDVEKSLKEMTEGLEQINLGQASISQDLVTSMKDRYKSYMDMTEHKDDYYIKTGIEPLDNEDYLGGLSNKDFGIIYARPNQGKSSLAQFIAVNAAKSGKKVLYYSGEVDDETLGWKMIEGAILGLPINSIQFGEKISKDNIDVARQYEEALNKDLSNIQISTIDAGRLPDLADIALLKSEMIRGNYDLLIIDQLYHLKSSSDENENKLEVEKMNSIANEVQKLQRQLGKPIIGVIQANRESGSEKIEVLCKGKDEKHPVVVGEWFSSSLKNISQSDRIGQNATWVINIEQNTRDESLCRISLQKNKRKKVNKLGWIFDVNYEKLSYKYRSDLNEEITQAKDMTSEEYLEKFSNVGETKNV